MIYLRLFFEFFKTGLFAIGGGLATLPFLQDMSARTGWFTTDQLADMIAVSECTPGPIGVNMATYAGFLVRGIPGAVTATLGLICPSVIVILILNIFFGLIFGIVGSILEFTTKSYAMDHREDLRLAEDMANRSAQMN